MSVPPSALGRGSVLFVNRVYPPEQGATGDLLAEVAEGLADLGWHVSVLSVSGDRSEAGTSHWKGVHIERIRGASLQRSSHFRRALGYLGMYPALLLRALRLPEADIIVTKTDPPLLATLGPLLRLLRGGRLVHWAQDLYPEVAEALGVLPPGSAAGRVLRWLSTRSLRACDRVLAIGACMQERLEARGIPPASIAVVPNWSDPALVYPVPEPENTFRHEHGLDGRFVVMYSGNLGLAHTFDALLSAAERMATEAPQALFMLVGDGPRRADVEAEATRRGLPNVRFLPYQPRERLAEALSAADLHIATMQPELEGLVVPSKVYGVLAAGRPCVFLGPDGSEAARLLQRYRCGTVLPDGNSEQLAAALHHWMAHPDERAAAGRRARLAAEQWDRRAAVQRFDTILSDVLAHRLNPAPVPA